MVRVRYTGGGTYTIRDGPSFTNGDQVADVSPREADRLTSRHDFEPVDEADAAAHTNEDDGDGDGGDGGDGSTDGDSWDADAWLEQGYSDRANRVRAGDVDKHLETIREVETSQTVKDAVDERLEG